MSLTPVNILAYFEPTCAFFSVPSILAQKIQIRILQLILANRQCGKKSFLTKTPKTILNGNFKIFFFLVSILGKSFQVLPSQAPIAIFDLGCKKLARGKHSSLLHLEKKFYNIDTTS
jgi:hypothetical protein